MIVAVLASMAAATSVSSCNGSGDDGPLTFGSSCRGVCEVYSIGAPDLQLNCDTANGGAGRTVAWAVSDYDGGGADRFSVFGIDGNGNVFCCVKEDADITEVLIDGGDHIDGDFLSFTYDNAAGGGVDADLEADVERATIQGNDGADEMYGTTVFTSAATVWFLEGGDHADTIEGFSADEDFDGGNGGDTIECGGGHDSAEGGPGSDDIDGGNGIDHLEGDTDGDVLHGGDDADTLLGGGGTDLVCAGVGGGGDTEYLSGGRYEQNEAGSDVLDTLWIPSGNTLVHDGWSQGNDECGHTTHGTSWAGGACDYSLSSAPGGC